MSIHTRHLLAVLLGLAGLTALPACNIFFGGNGNTNTNDNDDNTNDNDDNSNDNDDNTNDNDDNDNGTSEDFALFTDPDGDFSTNDIQDVDGETIKIRLSNQAIVYQDGREFQEGSWTVDGNFLAGGGFQVRFGTEGGTRKAFFTETGPATICDFRVNGSFQIFPTSETVPQE